MSWFGGLSIIERMARFVIGIYIARLLGPEPFGVFALAFLVLDIPDQVLRVPVGDAIVNAGKHEKEYLDLAWTLKLRKLPIAFLVFWFAPTIAAFFSTPDLIVVIRWLAIGFLIGALEGVGVIVATIQLNFRKIALYSHLIFWVEQLGILGLAIIFRNINALLGGFLIKNLGVVIFSYAFFPYKPHLHWNLSKLRELWDFTKWIWLGKSVSSVANQTITGIVGRSLDPISVGLYSKADSLVTTPMRLIQSSLSNVLFPAISSIKDDLGRVRRLFHSFTAIYLLSGVFLGGLTYYLADDLALILLGEQWSEMVPLLVAFIPVLFLDGPLSMVGTAVFKGLGEPKVPALIQAGDMALKIVAVPIGIHLFGLVGAVVGMGVSLLGSTMLLGHFVRRYNIANFRTFIKPYLVSISAFLCSVLIINNFLESFISSLLPQQQIMSFIVYASLVTLIYLLLVFSLTLFKPFSEIRYRLARIFPH